MSENQSELNQDKQVEKEIAPQRGPISQLLCDEGLTHTVNKPDQIGIEIINVLPNLLIEIVSSLKSHGFNYLECQGGYDEGPGKKIVCFYHLIEIKEYKKGSKPNEVRLKVYLDREGELKVPSLYKVFQGSDWQERETYDMFGVNFVGHPHPKRLLMPEDWKGWPLRKDYVQPDFYEMQDAF